MSENFLCLEDANIFYKVIGEGEPIIFLHGGPGLAHDYFLPHFLQLSDMEYKKIFFDQRGGGKSAEPFILESINLENIVDDIDKLRKKLNLEKISILGHSFGGFLAVKYALKYQQFINKLILCNSTVFDKKLSDEEEKIMTERVKEYDDEMMAYFYDKTLMSKLIVGPDFINEKVIDLTAKKLEEEYLNTLEKCNLNKIKVPTLIIHSDYDFVPYESSLQLTNMIQNSSLKLIENCGHFTFIEKCDELCRIIDDFMCHMSPAN